MIAPKIPHLLRTRLLLLPAAPLILWTIVMVLTYIQNDEMVQTFTHFEEQELRVYRKLHSAYSGLSDGHILIFSRLESATQQVNYSPEMVVRQYSDQLDLIDRVNRDIKIEDLVLQERGEAEKSLAALQQTLKLYRSKVLQSSRISSVELQQAHQLMGEAGEIFVEIHYLFAGFLQQVEQKTLHNFTQLKASSTAKTHTIEWVVSITFLIVLMLSIVLYIRLSRGFQQLLKLMQQVQAGDLGKVPEFASDEMGYLSKRIFLLGLALQDMRNSLEEKVEQRTVELQKVTHTLMLEAEKSKQMADQLRQQAETDELTKLYNRRYFVREYEHEWNRLRRQNHEVSMILLDIDHFKWVNDNFGHQVGDLCLRTVADALKSIARRSTDIVARYGGEEFAILMPETSLEQAKQVTGQILDEVSTLTLYPVTAEKSITVSAGVGSLDAEYGTKEDFLRAVDEALYRAKASGRNNFKVAYYSPMGCD